MKRRSTAGAAILLALAAGAALVAQGPDPFAEVCRLAQTLPTQRSVSARATVASMLGLCKAPTPPPTTPPPCVTPSAPRSLTAAVSGGLVSLTWLPPVTGTPTSYRIEGGTASGQTAQWMDTGTPATMTPATVIPPGVTFYVRVRGVSACGTGVASNEVSITAPLPGLPDPPPPDVPPPPPPPDPPPPPPPDGTDPPPPPDPGDPGAVLVQAGHFVYQGSFSLPRAQDTAGRWATEWAQGAIAFNPARNSLFFVGHDHGQQVAEFSIPALGGTANLLQPFRDATEGRMAQVDPGDPSARKVGGLWVESSKLIVTVYNYYDADGSARASHFVRPVALNQTGQVVGPFRVGTLNPGFHAGYFASVPAGHQAALGGPLLNGLCCIGIISRSSFGPAMFTPNLPQLLAGQTTSVQPLVYYTESQPLAGWAATSPLFNGTTQVRGAVLPRGTRTLLFIGRHGTGPFCYGICNDPEDSSQGVHAYPYQTQVWAYDVNDLARVRAGSLQPTAVRPYAVFRLPGAPDARPGGVAYDPTSGRIYISFHSLTGRQSVIAVYTLAL